IQKAFQANIWFSIGEPFENKVIAAGQKADKTFQVYNLRDSCIDPSSKAYTDPHLWMSVRKMIPQARLIAEKLEQLLPEKKDVIAKRLKNTVDELETLDHTITRKLESKKGK